MFSFVRLTSRYGKSGTYKIGVTFIQPSLKPLIIELHCSTVKIIDENVNQSDSWCFSEQFHLSSSDPLNNISSSLSVLLLPSHLQDHLHLSMVCPKSGWIYSSYLLVLKPYSLHPGSSLPLGHYRLHLTIHNIHFHQLQDYL